MLPYHAATARSIPPSMNKLLLLVAPFLLASAALAACATDNGDAVHGPQFGPPPERPDGSTDGPAVNEEGGPVPGDGGVDGDAPPTQACTTGTVVVLAGNNGTLIGSSKIASGPWASAAIANSAALNSPSIVAFGTGFLALTRGPANALQSMTFGASSWSTATAVGAVMTIGTPALAVTGTKAHAVYIAPSNLFFRAENAGTSWGITAEPVMAAAVQSFGQSAGGLAASGAELAFAQVGGDNDGLYTQKYDGAWSVGAPVMGAGTLTSAPPTLVAVDGKFDLVLLYADNTVNNVIGFATRDATTKLWSQAAITHANAQTPARPQVARVSPSKLVSTFLGNNNRPYTMTGTIGANAITWSVPVPLLADTSTVDGPPAVAKGVCGDEAIAVFASGGLIKATRYRGTSWSVPEAVTGASVAAPARVSVSTR
jgi:hypothetical protein